MRPKQEPEQPQRELFQIDLEQLLDMSHPLVRLGLCIDWSSFEQTLGDTYHPSQGAPGVSTRLMVALHYLKYQHDLSDEDVVAVWVENPYWQHFSGERYFQHRMPIDPSSMTRWRKRLSEAGAEQMLQVTIETGISMRVIGPAELKRVNMEPGRHGVLRHRNASFKSSRVAFPSRRTAFRSPFIQRCCCPRLAQPTHHCWKATGGGSRFQSTSP
jgi:IS5 family transposase